MPRVVLPKARKETSRQLLCHIRLPIWPRFEILSNCKVQILGKENEEVKVNQPSVRFKLTTAGDRLLQKKTMLKVINS